MHQHIQPSRRVFALPGQLRGKTFHLLTTVMEDGKLGGRWVEAGRSEKSLLEELEVEGEASRTMHLEGNKEATILVSNLMTEL